MVFLSQLKFLNLSSIFLFLFFLLSPQSILAAKTEEGSCIVTFSAGASNCLGADETGCDKKIKEGKPCVWKTEKLPSKSVCEFKSSLLKEDYCTITNPESCNEKNPLCVWLGDNGCKRDHLNFGKNELDSQCDKKGKNPQDCFGIVLFNLTDSNFGGGSCEWNTYAENTEGSCELDKKSAEIVCSAQKTPETCANPADNYKYVCEWKIPEPVTQPGVPIPQYKGIPFTIPSVEDLNKIGTTDASILIARIIKTLMGILGSISLVMFVYSGILYMTDSGNSERAGKAKQIFVWNSLGLIVIFASYAIVKMIFEAF